MINGQKYHVSKNLFDKDNITYYLGYVNNSGEIQAYPQNAIVYIPITYGKTYTIFGMKRYNPQLAQRYITTGKIPTSGVTSLRSWQISQNEPLTFTAEENEKYFCIMACGDSDYSAYGSVVNAISINCNTVMLNEGSFTLPYEPYSSEVWHDTPIPTRKLHNATDVITSLPQIVYTDGQSASADILGNMEQNGTPSPSSIIMPDECGDRTENLFDDHNIITIAGLGDRYGVILPEGQYSIYNDTDNIVYDGINDFMNRHIACEAHSTATVTLYTEPGKTCGFLMALNAASQGGVTIVSGSTPPSSYIPYGYKLDIKTGSTTPVYLGEVQSMRKIKKVVLTGQESGTWSYNPTITTGNAFYNESSTIFPNYNPQKSGYCTHYATTASASTVNEGVFWGANINFITDKNDGINTSAKWVQFLADQYSAGTPVTVWYILKNETTGTLNEPLRKIGDYADSVSVTGIPTTAGGQTFDIDTTLKPSEVSLTYHGWHDISPLQRENGEWV